MEKSTFFNSQNGDRVYTAEDFAAYFSNLVTNGVFPEPSTNLQVMNTSTYNLSIQIGTAYINGYLYNNSQEKTITLAAADGALARIDLVVIQLDHVLREIKTIVKMGSYSETPIAPTVTRNEQIHELAIAEITIPAAAITIEQADIIDTRMDTSRCGWVNSIIQADTESIFIEFQSWFDTKTAQWAVDWNAWFDAIQLDASNHEHPDHVKKPALIADAQTLAWDELSGEFVGANQESGTTVEDSTINGNILVDGVELEAYKHPSTHAISEVANLQTTLNGKSATNHNHTGTYQPTGDYVEKPATIADGQLLKWNEATGTFSAIDQAKSDIQVYDALANAPVTPKYGTMIGTVQEANFYVAKTVLGTTEQIYDIPALTTDNDQGFITTASSEGVTTRPFQAFNKIANSVWRATADEPQWIAIEFPEKHVITGFKYNPYDLESQQPLSPVDLDFIGVNDDATEDVLLAIRNNTELGNGSQTPHFVVPNTKAYKKYKFLTLTMENINNPQADEIVFDELVTSYGWQQMGL